MAKFGDTNTQDDMPAAAGTGPSGYVASYNTTIGSGAFVGSSTATGLQIVNLPVTAGRFYLVDVLFNYSTTNILANNFLLHDGANVGQVASISTSSAVGQNTVYGSLLYSPSTTGLKTLRLDIVRISGTGSMTFVAGAGYPIQLVVTDIGGPLATTGRGLVAYQTLTTNQASSASNPATDALTVNFTTVAGATYKASLLTPFAKTDQFGTWGAAIVLAGTGQSVASIPAVAAGEISGSVIYVPGTGGTSVTVGVSYNRTSGSDNNLSFPGSATAPRQLWVERIG